VVGATDSRYYAGLTPNVLRFVGATIRTEDVRTIHGTNERIGLRAYADAVRVYMQLLKNAAL
jgi:carboxypeptidase PM20D1